MKLYPKLAFSGMVKNARICLPYLITASVMAAMIYIMGFLNFSTMLETMRGAGAMGVMISLGWVVIAIFSAVILFYTHTFLIRRRMKEFGLYNILGMGKGSVCAILLWENVITAASVAVLGVLIGVAFSKLAELLLFNITHIDVGYEFEFSPLSATITVIYCLFVFALIFAVSAIRLKMSDPVGMMRSEAAGEKPPKVNWLFGVFGFILLAAAYYLAVRIDDPIETMDMFFFCVLMVIAATFMLFISGSVMVCRLLKNNKGYYYRPNHFVPVAQMSWRMKRNGAGLAAICVLCTMVLVTIVTTTCLYAGSQDRLENRYNNDLSNYIVFDSYEDNTDENYNFYREIYDRAYAEYGITPTKVSEFTFGVMEVPIKNGEYVLDRTYYQERPRDGEDGIDTFAQAYIISADDYSRESGENITLSGSEAAVYARGAGYGSDTLWIGDMEYRVKTRLEDEGMVITTHHAVGTENVLYIIVPDLHECVEHMRDYIDTWTFGVPRYYRYYGIDTDAPDDVQINAFDKSRAYIQSLYEDYDGGGDYEGIPGYTSERSLASDKAEFYYGYGTLFFLGIFFSVIFLIAAFLIMYYRQISEGYEDQARFGIMRKVGMTDKDIRRSVNSQVLTVFFAPLAMAVLHLCFAYPMLSRMIYLFDVDNKPLLLMVAAISAGIFALGYLIMYRITSRGYYAIVSEKISN